MRSATTPDGWRAKLALRYRCAGERTVVASSHEGPLVVQRSLHPEGGSPCQNIIVHPPGGIAGGDRLEVEVDVDGGAFAQLSTPGATRWYRSNGRPAEQRSTLRVAERGRVEWLPQESIVYDWACARQHASIDLAPSAVYVGWEIFCLGRTAMGERFEHGSLELETRVSVGGALRWFERARLHGGGLELTSPLGLNALPVFGTLLAYAPSLPPELIDRCRNTQSPALDAAVTVANHVLVARFRGRHAEAGRAWFTALWQLLRPVLIGRRAVIPRIWNT